MSPLTHIVEALGFAVIAVTVVGTLLFFFVESLVVLTYRPGPEIRVHFADEEHRQPMDRAA